MLTGSCLCGAIRFHADAPLLFLAHCHCRWCRRAHGAGFVTWTGVAAERVHLDGALTWYRSSARSERGFCGRCGSTLFFRSSAAPGELHIAAANVDTGLDRAPSAHIFVEQKAPWITLPDDLPALRGDHPALAAYTGDPGTPPK